MINSIRPGFIRSTCAILLLFVATSLAGAIDLSKAGNAEFYTALRMDYAKKPDFEPNWEVLDERKAIFAAFKAHDPIKTLALGKAWLDKVPVDAEVYMLIAITLQDEGDIKGYCEYISPFYGLIESITAQGDGRSVESAFKVISVGEEYYVLRAVGAKVTRQTLVGHCDKMEVELRGGKQQVIYFDVAISLEAMTRTLQRKQ